jgi:RNA polymerase sigma factor (sigma-70 family)
MKDTVVEPVVVSSSPSKSADRTQEESPYALVLKYQRYLKLYAGRVCRRFKLPASAFDDVSSYVTMAALEAAPDYNPELASFPTYLRMYLWTAVCNYLAENGRVVYIPPGRISRLWRVSELVSRYRECNEPSSSAVLAQAIGATVKEIESLGSLLPSLSLDSPVVNGEEGSATTFVDLLESCNPSACDTLVCKECCIIVQEALSILSSRDEYIVRLMVFGLDGVEYDHRQIAALLGMTHQNVSLIKQAALKKLYAHLRRKRLRFVDLVAG